MSYRNIEGAEPDAQMIAALTHHLRPDETPVAGARAWHFQFGFNKLESPTLLITNQRLVVAKDKLFGKPKPTVSVPLSDLASTGFGPLHGVGPTWEAHFHTTNNEPAIMYFKGPAEAEAFKNALHDAAMGTVNGANAPRQSGESPEPDPAFDARLQRLHDLVDDLRPLAGPESLGRPFGEGCGLEEAMRSVFARLESPDDARQCDGIMAVELLVNTKDDQAAQELLAVMGATPEALHRSQLTSDVRKAVEGLAGAAHTFLGQFDGPGNLWDLWNQRDDVPAEFLCWHTVARLRMATAGRMPEVVRP